MGVMSRTRRLIADRGASVATMLLKLSIECSRYSIDMSKQTLNASPRPEEEPGEGVPSTRIRNHVRNLKKGKQYPCMQQALFVTIVQTCGNTQTLRAESMTFPVIDLP